MPLFIVPSDVTSAGTGVVAASGTLTVVQADIAVVSTTQNAIANAATADNCDLRIDGTVIGELRGVFLQSNGVPDDHSLAIGSTGRVTGNTFAGVELQGARATLANAGEIASFGDNGVVMAGALARVENLGLIRSFSVDPGAENGLLFAAGGFAYNAGTISAADADGRAIRATGSQGLRIENDGTLVGPAFAVETDAGTDRLLNRGTILGNVGLGDGDDIFDGAGGTVSGTVGGGAGNDVLRGGEADDGLSGGDGRDTLVGRAGDDSLEGGSSLDLLAGGAGDDLLVGGGGADTFLFARNGGADRVTDFLDGTDLLDVSRFGFDNFNQVLTLSTQKGAGLFIDLAAVGGGTVLVEGFSLAQFGAPDVII